MNPISDTEPFVVRCTSLVPFARPKLSVYANRIEFSGRTVSLASICHLWWDGQSVVGPGVLVDQTHTMKVYERGDAKPLVMKESRSMAIRAAHRLMNAYDYIAERTLAQRMAGYAEQLQSNGWFEYENAKFHKDGSVALKGKTHQLSSASFGVFNISFGWLSGLPTNRDRDVLFALIEGITGRRPTINPN
jgi:hypothetical protein